MPIPDNLKQSTVGPGTLTGQGGTVAFIDMNMVANSGMQHLSPPDNQIGQEGTPFAGHHRLKRPGDWKKGGKL